MRSRRAMPHDLHNRPLSIGMLLGAVSVVRDTDGTPALQRCNLAAEILL
jgi:hypothetical protein